MKKVLLVRYGEIAIRGSNRHLFERRLLNHIRRNIREHGKFWISKEQGRLLIESNDEGYDIESIVEPVISVLGICGVCIAYKFDDSNIQFIREAALKHMRQYTQPTSFKVETRRADKRYPLTSNEISADVGGYVFNNLDNMRVDVRNPEIVLHIELRNSVYIYTQAIKGLGGLPVGSSGRGVLMLSGGIDSPVAGFLMAKRGVELQCVYFDSPPFTSIRARQKVVDLAERLCYFAGDIKLHIVKLTDVQMHLKEKVQHEKMTILLKRAMTKAAELIAIEAHCQVLINGDSVGQVASQTLHAIESISTAAKLPILRPLAGMDKQEIIDTAKKIGTYEISIRPYEDCCTLYVPEHPETRPKESVIASIEAKLEGLDEMIALAVKSREVLCLSRINDNI